MELSKQIGTFFGFSAALAGLLALAVKPVLIFWGWLGAFLIVSIALTLRSRNLLVLEVLFGHPRGLKKVQRVLEDADGERVFVHVGYTVQDEMELQTYFDLTKRKLRENAFVQYTRVAVLRNSDDQQRADDMLKEFAKNPRFRFAVYSAARGVPLNVLNVSPRHVIIGFPSEPAGSAPQGDGLVLYIRSKTIYSALEGLRVTLWSNAQRLTDSRSLEGLALESRRSDLREVIKQ